MADEDKKERKVCMSREKTGDHLNGNGIVSGANEPSCRKGNIGVLDEHPNAVTKEFSSNETVHLENDVDGQGSKKESRVSFTLPNGMKEFTQEREESEAFITTEIQEHCNVDGFNKDARHEKNSHVRRHLLLHTLCVCGSAFSLGWTFGMIGPTFPDLRLIIQEDLGKSSWIFSGWSFGELLGCAFGGMAYDRFNKLGLFITVTFGLGGVVAVIPWCANFVVMLIAFIIMGSAAGVIKTASTADIAVVWRDRARSYLQAVYGVVCLGAIISPFVADPFLAKRLTSFQPSNMILNDTCDNKTLGVYNLSEYDISTDTPSAGGKSQEQNIDDIIYGETRIYIPYFIASGVACLFGVMYLVVKATHGNVYTKSVRVVQNTGGATKKKYFLNTALKNILTALVALAGVLYIMYERGFTQFLMTFVLSALKMTKSDGALASGIFWAAIAIGRLSAIFIVRKFKNTTMLVIYLTLQGTGCMLLFTSSVYQFKGLVLVSVSVTGFGGSIILGTLFSVLSEKIRELTGKISAMVFVSVSMAGMVLPLLLGYLMDEISPLVYVYYLLALFVLQTLCIVLIIVLVKAYKSKSKHKYDEKHDAYAVDDEMDNFVMP